MVPAAGVPRRVQVAALGDAQLRQGPLPPLPLHPLGRGVPVRPLRQVPDQGLGDLRLDGGAAEGGGGKPHPAAPMAAVRPQHRFRPQGPAPDAGHHRRQHPGHPDADDVSQVRLPRHAGRLPVGPLLRNGPGVAHQPPRLRQRSGVRADLLRQPHQPVRRQGRGRPRGPLHPGSDLRQRPPRQDGAVELSGEPVHRSPHRKPAPGPDNGDRRPHQRRFPGGSGRGHPRVRRRGDHHPNRACRHGTRRQPHRLQARKGRGVREGGGEGRGRGGRDTAALRPCRRSGDLPTGGPAGDDRRRRDRRQHPQRPLQAVPGGRLQGGGDLEQPDQRRGETGVPHGDAGAPQHPGRLQQEAGGVRLRPADGEPDRRLHRRGARPARVRSLRRARRQPPLPAVPLPPQRDPPGALRDPRGRDRPGLDGQSRQGLVPLVLPRRGVLHGRGLQHEFLRRGRGRQRRLRGRDPQPLRFRRRQRRQRPPARPAAPLPGRPHRRREVERDPDRPGVRRQRGLSRMGHQQRLHLRFQPERQQAAGKPAARLRGAVSAPLGRPAGVPFRDRPQQQRMDRPLRERQRARLPVQERPQGVQRLPAAGISPRSSTSPSAGRASR